MSFPRLLPLAALLALSLVPCAQAALLARWTADTYVAGANWSDTADGTPIVALQRNTPTVVVNAFGSHKGVDFSGGKYFTVPAASNPLAGKTSFTLAAVFRATAPGATGGNWYQASGLIGMEQGGIVNDFGFGWSGDGGGQVKAGIGLPQNGSDPAVTSPAVPINVTHAAVFTYNATTRALTLFVDGQQVATTTPAVAGTGRNGGEFGLGAITSAGLNTFPGLIAELQIYDTVENGAALSAALRTTYTPPELITSFSANKANAFEGEAVQLSWMIDTAPTNGHFTMSIVQGATTVYSANVVNGSTTTTIPSLAGTAQPVTYTMTVVEFGGNSYTDTAQVVVNGDPGIPSAASQSGLRTEGTTPKAITLAGSDPNGGALTYAIVAPPANGTLSGSGAAVTYTANAGFFGADSFSFKVNDGTYDSPTAVVALTVDAPPTAPTGITLNNSTVKDTATAGSFVAQIGSLDPNTNDPHTYALVGGVGATDNARFSVNGTQLRAAQSFAGLAGQQFSIRLRSTDSGGRSFEQTFVLTAITPQRGLVINEVLFNGVNNTVRDEFIEIYNAGTTTVDLTGWRVSGAVDYSFAAGTQIAPGAYVIVAQDPPTIQTRFAKTALGPWAGNLSSEGETIRLRNAADSPVSEVDYKVGFPWPVASDGDGTSIELINPTLDESHGSNWKPAVIPSPTATADTATPGAVNLQFAANAAPAVRQVAHAPVQPTGGQAIVVTARITDPDGVASANLLYQIVTPGNYIPSTLPRAISGGQFVGGVGPLPANPAFENAANWTTVAMNDEGIGADVQGGDGTWTATIPPQAHRTLVRYRIAVTDNLGANARGPYPDDKSLNFACFVYNGVPDYQGTSAAALTALPTYHFLTRKADYDQAVGYNSSLWLADNTPSRSFENWTAAFVYNGVVYDHVRYRLKGGNGRYQASGVPGAGTTSKRAFKFVFNKGYAFEALDQDGQPYPTPWSTIITENLWENRATYTFSLNEIVTFRLFNLLGVPAPLGHWSHFRTVMQTAEQPDAWHGDFWGLMYVHEDYDKEFLDTHDLEDGNLYKLTRDGFTGLSQFRYQAPFAPADGSDHDQLQAQLRGTSTPAFITGRVNLDLWARYHALAEAVRHYDYWPSGDNNAAYYFEPVYNASNNFKGILWYLPYDVDATWGPTWNNGHDLVHNSLFNDAVSQGGDTFTNPTLWPRYYNQVREVRDLLFQPDQINPLIDEYAAIIQPFVNAEFRRWHGAPASAGNFAGLAGPGVSSSIGQTSLAAYVADMKDFAFDANNNGGTWPGAGNIGVGGRLAFMNNLQGANGEAAQLPTQPTISAAGSAGFPVNDLRFTSSAFADPQGVGTFAAMQWRVAEITDPTAPAYVPGEKRKLEITASYDSGEITPFTSQFRFPAAAARAGHTYRARVRHKDTSGRWSRWSAPVTFTASAANVAPYQASLVISEIMYHPVNPTPAEAALGWAEEDFEYVEVRNIGATPIDLTDVRFTKGINFDFTNGYTLAAGASALVVRNVAAFTSRHGSGRPIAGTWEAGNILSNGGEGLKLSFGAGTAIVEFDYDDASPWPTSPDGAGFSLVLLAPHTRPNPALGTNWRASFASGGTPGGDDRITFASWGAANGGLTNPSLDTDRDGFSDGMEYALAMDPRASSHAGQPTSGFQQFEVDGVVGDYFTFTFRHVFDAADLAYQVEWTTDMSTWVADGVSVGLVNNGDGTVTEVWRAAQPFGAGAQFARLRVFQ